MEARKLLKGCNAALNIYLIYVRLCSDGNLGEAQCGPKLTSGHAYPSVKSWHERLASREKMYPEGSAQVILSQFKHVHVDAFPKKKHVHVDGRH